MIDLLGVKSKGNSRNYFLPHCLASVPSWNHSVREQRAKSKDEFDRGQSMSTRNTRLILHLQIHLRLSSPI